MKPILFLAGARHHLQHPWQAGLALLGVTLGVAVVTAVALATESARRAFSLSAEAVSGRATHEVVGGPGGLPDTLYATLLPHLAGGSAAPVVDRYVRVPGAGGRIMRLLGIDPFAEAPFRPWAAPAGDAAAGAGTLISRPAVLASAQTAATLDIPPGGAFTVRAGARATTVVLAGVLEPQDALARRALADLLIADVSTAQEVAGAAGVVDRIELRLPADNDAAAQVRAVLPPGARLLEAGARTGATLRMARAFETNLTALALVALVFGMFLIYNAVTFSLVQRRPLIALLRAQGVTSREVLGAVLLEAVIIGGVASAAGLAAGLLLGSGLVRLVARTVNDLYFTVSVTGATLTAATAATAVLLGVGGTAAAALAPALEAVHAPPRASLARATLERSVRRRARRFAIIGVEVAALSAALLALPSRSIVPGFAGLFVLILAAALLTPVATILLMAVLRPVVSAAGAVGRLAVRGVTASLSRTAPAIAALTVALSVGTAVTIMIGSFRTGVERWITQTLQADVYVSVPDLGADRTTAALPQQLPAALASLPSVSGVSTYRHVSLLVGDDVLRLIAAELDPRHRDAFQFLDGGAGAWPAFGAGGLLVSEPLAYRRGLSAGDSLALPTDRGPVTLPIAAVYRDYASEHGVIFIDRRTYGALWDDAAITSVGVFAAPGTSADLVLGEIRSLPEAAGTVLRPNRALRESTMETFDRTFAITGVLRVLALLVAFIGVTGALMALQLERGREIGVLRTTGLTPAQVWALVTSQTALMGLAAAILAAPLGWVMAWAMVHVVNRRAFGWTFDMVTGAAPFGQAVLVGVGAALLAGIWPAWRMARLRPAEALREE